MSHFHQLQEVPEATAAIRVWFALDGKEHLQMFA